MLGRIAVVVGAVMSMLIAAAPARSQTRDTLQPRDTTQRVDTTVLVKGLKSPHLAEALGIFPGGGMFYAGEWKEGLRAYFGTVGAVGAGGMTILLGELQGCGPLDLTCKPHGSVWPTRIAGGAMIATGIGFWGYEAVQAGRIVRRKNAKKIAAARRAALTDVQPLVAPTPDNRGITLGFRATW